MPVLPADIMMATDMDYDSIAKAGSMLGSGAVIVMDETRCMVKSLLRLSYFYFEESCGQCTPCREGTGWLYRMVDRIEHGKGQAGRPRSPEQRRRQHPGPHDLRAGRCGGDAGARVHQALPRRVPASHRSQAVPGEPGRYSSRNRSRMAWKSEIDGRKLEVPDGSTVMDAANQVGIYVPHFCYHKKLSIAANCRMCLVQVEKAPKPLPACATPVTNGMKVYTHSEQAVTAQKGVMEFLLINHPLDCPICDQGGECQLQDLAVGYGASGSRYEEPKRVVNNKNLGPLISTDMTRCIHCTRCVRFGQEIAGIMELGMIGRGEHAEIIAFVGKTVDSELSGNMIDLCPVGALTSKPFRYSARTWELSRRKSVSPHCGLGSNLTVQVKQNRVMRVLPRENEAINECWLSDKDRFSYEGLNSAERLAKPMIKQNGAWHEVDWQVALEFVAHGLGDIRNQHGADAIGALATPHQTLEELHLLQKLVRGLGSNNVDFRLRQGGLRRRCRRAVAGHADRRHPAARPRAGRRLHAAQGSSVAREPLAPGGEESAAGQPDQSGRRRFADARGE